MMWPLLRQRWHRHEKLRFLVVGGWNTVFGYVTFLILYAGLQKRVHYLVIAVMAHLIAVVNAFVCHRLLVFRRGGPWRSEFLRFNLSQLAVLGCGLLGLWLLVSLCRLEPLVAQLLMTIVTIVFGYVAHRHFTFAGS